jgi:hypothetical protein
LREAALKISLKACAEVIDDGVSVSIWDARCKVKRRKSSPACGKYNLARNNVICR